MPSADWLSSHNAETEGGLLSTARTANSSHLSALLGGTNNLF